MSNVNPFRRILKARKIDELIKGTQTYIRADDVEVVFNGDYFIEGNYLSVDVNAFKQAIEQANSLIMKNMVDKAVKAVNKTLTLKSIKPEEWHELTASEQEQFLNLLR